MTIDINLNPEAARVIIVSCVVIAFYTFTGLVRWLVDLKSRRRKEALFESIAREAMASGRPITFSHDTIKRQ